MSSTLDLNRPYIMRQAAGPASPPILMYKGAPGVYYGANGLEVSVDVARKAGFKVESDAVDRRLKEKLAEKHAEIEAEYDEIRKEAEADARKEIAAEDTAEPVAVAPGPMWPPDPEPAPPAVVEPVVAPEPEPIEPTEPGVETAPNEIIDSTSAGEPRETVARKMEYEHQVGWHVIDKRTGLRLGEALHKDEAEDLLLAEG